MNPASAAMVRWVWRRMPFKAIIKPVARGIQSSRLMPNCWMRCLRAYRILSFDYGHMRSAAMMRSVDRDGNPVPWITYPACAFLQQLDFRDKVVFEYGCGDSTVFWSRVAAHVDSVEDNMAFCREVWPRLPENCTLRFEPDPDEYIQAVAKRPGGYDLIVIDGHSRVRCAEIAPRHLRSGGVIILDNSDWFSDASGTLREADLIEVDMAGLAPINDFVTTTSFYFHREFRGASKSERQPVGAPGSRPKPPFPKVTRREPSPTGMREHASPIREPAGGS